MSVRPVRVGVIGSGLIAQRSHLPAYAATDKAEVVAICGIDAAEAQSVAARFGIPRIYSDWRELVADPAVEAVDVCTPNALHAEMAVGAARAGKGVLVEKPMAVSLAQADAMIAAAREAGVPLLVSHNLRFAPVYQAVKRLLDEDTIGRPVAWRGVYMHAGPDVTWGATSDWFWQEAFAGGGAMLDLGIHMFDVLRWLAGEPVVEVSAMTARAQKPTFADDNAIALLRFAGGAIASVQSSWTQTTGSQTRLMILGERGQIALDRQASPPLVATVRAPGSAENRRIVPEIPAPTRDGDPFVHFARVVRDGVAPICGGEEGRATLAVALAAYEAARTGRTVALEPLPRPLP